MHDALALTSSDKQAITDYRLDGFARIPDVLSPRKAAHSHDASLAAAKRLVDKNHCKDITILSQFVNSWQDAPILRQLTLNPMIGAIVEDLAGVKLRLWHDHLLTKTSQNSTLTEFHQDQPYWPHADSCHALSVWITLCNAPVERSCMSFIPRSHRQADLPAQNLSDLLPAIDRFAYVPG